MTQKELTDDLRTQILEDAMRAMAELGEYETLQTASGTFMMPVLDKAGNERWAKISVIIPKDAEEENGTDGYSLANEYNLKVAAAKERKEKAAAEKEKKKAKANKE